MIQHGKLIHDWHHCHIHGIVIHSHIIERDDFHHKNIIILEDEELPGTKENLIRHIHKEEKHKHSHSHENDLHNHEHTTD